MKTKERTIRKLETSGRITPREVLEAYEETGLKPQTNLYLTDDKACAYGALMVRSGVNLGDEGPDHFLNTIDRKAGYGYSVGFFNGFDGRSSEEFARCALCPEEMTGWRDGRRARRFVFGGAS